MSDTLTQMLDADARFAGAIVPLLQRYGIWQLCCDIEQLFESLRAAAASHRPGRAGYSIEEYMRCALRCTKATGTLASPRGVEKIRSAASRVARGDDGAASAVGEAVLSAAAVDSLDQLDASYEAAVRSALRRLDGVAAVEDGRVTVAMLDAELRDAMLLVVCEEYMATIGHFVRGHVSKMAGHVRRAIECAVAAWASRSRPEVGFMWAQNDRGSYRAAVRPARLLSAGGPFEILLRGYNSLSEQAHPNATTTIARVEYLQRPLDGGRIEIGRRIMFNEFDFDDPSLSYMLLLSALLYFEQCAALLAKSFGIPEVEVWPQRHAQVHRDLGALRERLIAEGVVVVPDSPTS